MNCQNRNTTHTKTEHTLTQEQKINSENLKRIMNKKKTTLPSLRNMEWRNVKTVPEKINQMLTYTPTKNIIELNWLIYEGAKLICGKIDVALKSIDKKSKPGWEIRLEMQIKKSTKINQNDKLKEKRWNILGQTENSNTIKKIIQLEEINQKVLTKEGRLKRYLEKVKQYRQKRTFQNNERKFYQQVGWNDTKTY